MDIKYNILWFEDNDEWFKTISRRLKRYISKRNLVVNIERIKNATQFKISEYDLRDFEMLIVDFELENKTYGQDIIKSVRSGDFMNDVLFYSSSGYKVISDIMRKERLQGVFIADRENNEFIRMASLLVDKSLRRAENLINIRGIVMDTTSDFDENIKEIILKSWRFLETEEEVITEYIRKTLLDIQQKTCEKYVQRYKEDTFDIEALLNEREFNSYMKARLLNKILSSKSCLKEKYTQVYSKYFSDDKKVKFFNNYNTEIIKVRNDLAHVNKVKGKDGVILIGSNPEGTIEFDSRLCMDIRKNLIKYDEFLEEVLCLLKEEPR